MDCMLVSLLKIAYSSEEDSRYDSILSKEIRKLTDKRQITVEVDVQPKRMKIEENIRIVALSESKFAANSREIITMHFVENNDLKPLFSFHPEYTYQFFESEVIIGFKDLFIDIYFNKSTMKCSYNINYTESIDHIIIHDQPIKQDNLEEIISELLSYNISEYDLMNESNPFENLVMSNDRFCCYLSTLEAEEEIQYFRRVETFSLFFIEGADRINPNDNKWRVLLVFSKDRTTFYGYVTLYAFSNPFRHPIRTTIMRICQFLVLPFVQHLGIGKLLMDYIYDYVYQKNCLELTVESPGERFEKFRDIYDVVLLSKTEIYNKPLHQLSSSEIKELSEKFRITSKQLVRGYEIFRLTIMVPAEYKDLTILIKKRIYKENRDLINELQTDVERRNKLREYFSNTEAIYNEITDIIRKIIQK